MPPKSYKCGGCEVVRMENRFSKTSIRKYEQAVGRANRARAYAPRNNKNGIPDEVPNPRCMDCTNSSVHELKCLHCDVSKSLEQFSKRMRKDPDNALCLNCSQDRQDLEPDHRDQVQEEITMDRIRVGATLTNIGRVSTAVGYGASSRTIGRSNGLSASTNNDNASDWINAPIPIPEDPRARSVPSSHRSRSPSNMSQYTHVSNNSAITGTGWDDFERTNAPYREQVAAFRRSSNSTSSRVSSNAGFVKQGAVRQDHYTKAQNSLARQQLREIEQAEQVALHDSDDSSDDDDDDEPAY